VNTLDTESGGAAGPWILACSYCNWTSLEIGIKLEKSTNIYHQVQKILHPEIGKKPSNLSEETPIADEEEPKRGPVDPDARFALIKNFYKAQLSNSSSSTSILSPGGDINYDSPSSLSRIMNLYTGLGSYGKKPPCYEQSEAEDVEHADTSSSNPRTRSKTRATRSNS
jgi:dynactin-4